MGVDPLMLYGDQAFSTAVPSKRPLLVITAVIPQDDSVARLPILESTIKQLYGTATTCAYPTCDQPLLRWVEDVDTPLLNSRIAHICAASAQGPRYDEEMNDEARRAFDNLILLCLPHAEEIDLKVLAARYPVETLRQWKIVQLQTAPLDPVEIPEGVLERAVVLSMDFRGAIVDLGGKAATAPGAGGSGGGAIGPGARGGDGGHGGSFYELTFKGEQLPDKVEIEVGRAGRSGVDDLPGEAGGNTSFGGFVTPGGGRKTHSTFPESLTQTVETSVSAAVFARHVEINGLSYLSGAGWDSYDLDELPGRFGAALYILVDVAWVDLEPGTEIPIEVIAELLTPIKTATFSEESSRTITVPDGNGFARVPFAFSLVGTLHDPGLHILHVTCNTGARLGQYLNVRLKPSPQEPNE